MNLAKSQDTKSIYRSPLYTYTLAMKNQKDKLKKQSYSPIATKRIKYLGINIHMEIKELYAENYESLMKEMKNDTKKWRAISCSWIGRIDIGQKTILPRAIYRFSAILSELNYQ